MTVISYDNAYNMDKDDFKRISDIVRNSGMKIQAFIDKDSQGNEIAVIKPKAYHAEPLVIPFHTRVRGEKKTALHIDTMNKPYDRVVKAIMIYMQDRNHSMRIESADSTWETWQKAVKLFGKTFGIKATRPERILTIEQKNSIETALELADYRHQPSDIKEAMHARVRAVIVHGYKPKDGIGGKYIITDGVNVREAKEIAGTAALLANGMQASEILNEYSDSVDAIQTIMHNMLHDDTDGIFNFVISEKLNGKRSAVVSA